MSLRRVDTTFDLPEAHIIVGLLRAEGIDAHVFDADFVRQDWFKAIAYGGYRILVPDAQVQTARAHLRDYRDQKPALSDDNDSPCPSCAASAYRDDPRPRRRVFAIYMAQQLVVAAVILEFIRSPEWQFIFALATIAADVLLAALAIVYLKRRYLCDRCGHRWRDPLQYRYASLDAVASGATD